MLGGDEYLLPRNSRPELCTATALLFLLVDESLGREGAAGKTLLRARGPSGGELASVC